MPELEKGAPDDQVAQTTFSYIRQAEMGRHNRIRQNRINYDTYHLRQDFSHKKTGQSTEFLAKQQTAVDQLTSFLTQGLIDIGVWFGVTEEFGIEQPLFQNHEIEKLLKRQLEKNKFPWLLNDTLQTGLLASLMICKVGGELVSDPQFFAEPGPEGSGQRLKRVDIPNWQLKLSLVRPENWYPDPENRGLYEIEYIEKDLYQMIAIAEANPDLYDIEAVKAMSVTSATDQLKDRENARETDQNITLGDIRRSVGMWECWGTILDKDTGEIMVKDGLKMQNVVWAVGENGRTIRKPRKNPFWHNTSPYVVSPIIRVAQSVWHRALMDAATLHNKSLNEIYNYMLDAGLMSVFGIRQIHEDWLEDPNQISEGIPPGTTLQVNNSAPPGAKVMETVATGSLDREALEMFNLTDREFQQTAMTNDTRLGNLPEKAVKATEIIASNQSLTGVFAGVVKSIEQLFVSKVLEKSWAVMAQNMDDLDSKAVAALIGEARAVELEAIPKETRFAETVSGRKYKVFGLSNTVAKVNDFRKIQGLLQTVASDPKLRNEFEQEFSLKKLLAEIMKALDIDTEKIKASDEEKQRAEQDRQLALKKQEAEIQTEEADAQSQIPQASSGPDETGLDIPRQEINEQANA